MAWTNTNLTEKINTIVNQALAGGLTTTQIATALTAASTAVTALATPGPAPTHDRTIQDPGPSLNPSQP